MGTDTAMLIIEDHDEFRLALKEFMQTAFPAANIQQAVDGASALALCADRHFGLVLTDLGLPDTNGIELIPRIRALLPETPVVVVSQQSASVYAEKAREAGAAGYVSKDRIHRELLPAVAGAIAIAKQRRPQ